MSAHFVDSRDAALGRKVGAHALVLRTPHLAEVIEAVHRALDALDAPPPTPASVFPRSEHKERLAHRLKQPAALNATLLQRCRKVSSLASLDPDVILRSLAALVLARMADACEIDVVEDGPTLRRAVSDHGEPAKLEVLLEMSRRYPPKPGSLRYQVLETNIPTFAPTRPAMRAEMAEDEEHLRMPHCHWPSQPHAHPCRP